MTNLSLFPHHEIFFRICYVFVTPFTFPTSKIYCKSISHAFNVYASSIYPVPKKLHNTAFTIVFSATNVTWVIVARWSYTDLPNLTHHNLSPDSLSPHLTLKCTFPTIKCFLQFRHGLQPSKLYHMRTIFLATCRLLSCS